MNKLLKILLCFMIFIILIKIGFSIIKKTVKTEIKNSETINNIDENNKTNIDESLNKDSSSNDENKEKTNETSNNETNSNMEQESSNFKFFDTDSILIIANKKHPLPDGYKPNDLVKPNVKSNKNDLSLRKEAANAMEEMFEAAKSEGINLVLGSSFRSYEYQRNLYNRYVKKDGEELASKYSSKPGQSEHQTGLAADISDEEGKYFLKQSFKDTKEGIWLKENSYKYGYILRYPEGKEDVTGYMFEPWHFRYIGKEEAEKVYNSNLSLEEYYNILD